MAPVKLHPAIDGGIKSHADNGNGGKLRCKCNSQPVEVTLDSNVAFNHACKSNTPKPESTTPNYEPHNKIK